MIGRPTIPVSVGSGVATVLLHHSGFDAIHLASALTLTELPVIVATWDARLLSAAQSLSLETLPAQL